MDGESLAKRGGLAEKEGVAGFHSTGRLRASDGGKVICWAGFPMWERLPGKGGLALGRYRLRSRVREVDMGQEGEMGW